MLSKFKGLALRGIHFGYENEIALKYDFGIWNLLYLIPRSVTSD